LYELAGSLRLEELDWLVVEWPDDDAFIPLPEAWLFE
jgi:hypothetical protein